MYRCDDCGAVFDEPKEWQEIRGEFWGVPCYESISGCPYCAGENYYYYDEESEEEW